MATTYEYQSAFARKYVEQGLEQGRAEGEALMLLRLLRAVGIAVTDAVRDRVMACTDIEQLNRWADRAATVTTADELFA